MYSPAAELMGPCCACLKAAASCRADGCLLRMLEGSRQLQS